MGNHSDTDIKIDSILSALEELTGKALLQNDRYLELEEVKDFTGMSVSSIYNNINSGDFPSPHKFGRNSRWLLSEIIEHGKANRSLARPNNQPSTAS